MGVMVGRGTNPVALVLPVEKEINPLKAGVGTILARLVQRCIIRCQMMEVVVINQGRAVRQLEDMVTVAR